METMRFGDEDRTVSARVCPLEMDLSFQINIAPSVIIHTR